MSILLFICLSLVACKGTSPTDEHVLDVIDFTLMSDSERADMLKEVLNNPTEYVGKFLKVAGSYRSDFPLHFVTVEGASPCCSTGMEFAFDVEQAIVDGTFIELTGIFAVYREGDRYGTRLDAETLTTLESR